MFKAEDIKKDFPILQRQINGNELVYMDNSSTTQKPQVVLDALMEFYTKHNANVHRGIHTLSEEATDLYESSREAVRKFIGANNKRDIIFTRNTTEAINLVAYTWGSEYINEEDVILTTEIEHHSNFVPWQQLAKRKNAKRIILGLNENFQIKLDDLKAKLETNKVKLIAIGYISNVLGSIQPIREICDLAHKYNVLVLIDAAQTAPHMPLNVQELGCDFLAFSAHKMCGPTGVGVLYVKSELSQKMSPFMTGGGMIERVELNETSWADTPDKFEAGTPNIADVVAFKAAIEYLNQLGMENIWMHEKFLTEYAMEKLSAINKLKLIGPTDIASKASVFSFTLEGIHAHDASQILNNYGVAVRSGHHCTQPLHDKLNITATSRASLYIYNTIAHIDKLIYSINECIKYFNK